MATLVSFHAHPDDESIATGGTIAKAVADGHRVVLVMATRGEMGEVADDFLDPGEQLGIRRIGETFESAKVLGVHRVEFLGYVDSGMMGESTNDRAYSFWRADVDAAAAAAGLAGVGGTIDGPGPMLRPGTERSSVLADSAGASCVRVVTSRQPAEVSEPLCWD